MVTGIYAGRFFTMATDCRKSGIFAKTTNAVILWMVKIIAADLTFFASVTYV